MANPAQSSTSILRRSFGLLALALTFALTIVATPSAQAQTLNTLYNFTTGGNVGYSSFSGLVMDRAGRLYGTNSSGGEHGDGTVYRVARAGSSWVATGLYSFQGGTDGAHPVADVTLGPDGTLYGTTFAGGVGYGTVFNLRPPATVCRAVLCPWTETVLYRFTGGRDGGFGGSSLSFADALVFDQAGNIYGTTPIGGAYGDGVVFKLILYGQSWTESVLWSFTGGSDGGNPLSGVIFDSAGNLYGTTEGGGAHQAGVVYELSPSGSGWTQQTLYSFSGEDSDGYPFGGVTMDAQGNLYGTTGGTFGNGEAYELTLSGGNWIVSRRQPFTAPSGGPFDTPTLDAQGNLYGTINTGGNYGEVFKLTPSGDGWIYTHFYDFSEETGEFPVGGVIFDASGNLYGTTIDGGQDGVGNVWELTP